MNRRNYIRSVGASVLTPAVSITSNELTPEEFISELPAEVNGKPVEYYTYDTDAVGRCVTAHFQGGRWFNSLYFRENADESLVIYNKGVSHVADSVQEAIRFSNLIDDTVSQNQVFRKSSNQLRNVAYRWYLFADQRIVDPRYAHTSGDDESTYYYHDGVEKSFNTVAEKRSDINETIKTEVGWSATETDRITGFLQKTHFDFSNDS